MTRITLFSRTLNYSSSLFFLFNFNLKIQFLEYFYSIARNIKGLFVLNIELNLFKII